MPSDADFYRQRARFVKAQRLAAHLDARGMSITDVQGMHPNLREHYAKQAGVHAPSEETWTEVVNHLGAMHRAREKYKDQDPFEGLS